MIRTALTILILTASAPASQAAFFWEGLLPYMDKAYCLKHYPAERCASLQVKVQAQTVKPPAQQPRPSAPPPKRPVAQK